MAADWSLGRTAPVANAPASHALRARSNTFCSFLPRMPFCSALWTLCNTSGHRLHLGLERQHFFFGFAVAYFSNFT
jgi:hypothetical protein